MQTALQSASRQTRRSNYTGARLRSCSAFHLLSQRESRRLNSRNETNLQEALKDNGFTLARSKKHHIYKDVLGKTFVTPSTPSDHRGANNAWSNFRRLFPEAKAQDDRPLRAQRIKTRLEPQPFVLSPLIIPATLSKAEAKQLRKEERMLARWEAEDREARKQRGLLRAYFVPLANLCHNEFWEIWESHDKTEDTYQDAMNQAMIDAYTGLSNMGFSPKILVGEIKVGGIANSFFLSIGVSGFFWDAIENEVYETPTWPSIDGDGATFELYGELKVERNKHTGMCKVSS